MEMMDTRAAIRWLNESSDLMTVIVKNLESQPKGEPDTLKRELISAQRATVETLLNSSMVTAILISEQMILELPLLMGHSEDHLALVKAQGRYREESDKACAVLKNTAPVNQTAPVAPDALELGTPADRMKEGFTIDIGEAKALRNIGHRLTVLMQKRYEPSKNGGPLTAAEIAEESELRALISKKSSALACPPGYGAQDAMEDSNRLHQLDCKRLSPPSCGGGELKGADDEEEAFLTARVAAFQHSPEGRDRQRITELEVYRQYRDNNEQAELDRLRAVYPKGPESELAKAIKLKLEELRQQSK
jgi:hypothetical protein